MDVKLVVDRGPTRTRTIPLRSAETTIGRHRQCNLRIPSAEVSRRHCRLVAQDGYLVIEDLDSINGTFLNGSQVRGQQAVRPGDQLEIGPFQFTVNYTLAAEAREHLNRTFGAAVAEEPIVASLVEETEAAEPMGLSAQSLDVDLIEEQDLAPIPMDPDGSETGPAEPGKFDLLIDPEEDQPLVLDDGNAWDLPEGEALRDILTGMDH